MNSGGAVVLRSLRNAAYSAPGPSATGAVISYVWQNQSMSAARTSARSRPVSTKSPYIGEAPDATICSMASYTALDSTRKRR